MTNVNLPSDLVGEEISIECIRNKKNDKILIKVATFYQNFIKPLFFKNKNKRRRWLVVNYKRFCGLPIKRLSRKKTTQIMLKQMSCHNASFLHAPTKFHDPLMLQCALD